ncbi:hypothetical protein [Planctomyces sp. SH-PL14]|uniref:hypothetical protein n=1 Tax=Planctomyces sp. SH-PL14 TaxID=1632864 RepID=UPI00078DD07F|nr:hypothetical protein [Planctomyces sp. SH-PL14]AMV22278.1 hypothetical protein VT03_30520 [Planctomyces sp. SH-PL14]
MSWRRRAAAALLSLVCVLQMLAPCRCVADLALGSICRSDGTHIHLARTACSHVHADAHTDGQSTGTVADDGTCPEPEHHLCPRCRGHVSPPLERVEINRTPAGGPPRDPLLFSARTPGVCREISRTALHRATIDDWIVGARPKWAPVRLQI